MAHLIKSAAFSQADGAGWTGLGQVIPANIANDPAKIAELVGAVYNVLTVPLQYKDPVSGEFVNAENRVAQVRSDTGDLLEITSANRYHTDYRQPIDVFEAFRDELAKESMTISHAAVLAGGRKIAVCARLGEAVIVTDTKGKDTTLPYVTMATGYDKMTGSNGFLTTVRTVCDNTLRMGMGEAEKAKRLVRYTAAQKLTEYSLKDMLSMASACITDEIEFYQRLTQAHISVEQARSYFSEILGIDQTLIGTKNADGRKVISTRSENQLNGLMTAYTKGPGSDLDSAKDTIYGALNAVTYVVDHESQIRDTRADGAYAARLTSATFGAGAQTKVRAAKEASKLFDSLMTQVAIVDHDTEFSDLLAGSVSTR